MHDAELTNHFMATAMLDTGISQFLFGSLQMCVHDPKISLTLFRKREMSQKTILNFFSLFACN